MAAAGVTLFRTAGFTAALAWALLTAAHRFGLRRRSFLSAFAGAGVVASSALAFLAAVHRFLCAAATRLRAYSERCRSPFRGDGDRDSELMPITIPR